MTFEEEFPSLIKLMERRNQFFELQRDDEFGVDEIQECCLDKQRVREAIEKVRGSKLNGAQMLSWFEKELGL